MADQPEPAEQRPEPEGWLHRFISFGRSSRSDGDVIGGIVGENAQHVVVGKNNIQIGSITIPRAAAWMLAVAACLGLFMVAYMARQAFFVVFNTTTLADTASRIEEIVSTPPPVPTATSTPAPLPLDGDFNIAIAQFGEVGPDGVIRPSKRTAKFTQALCNYLDSEFRDTEFGLQIDMSHRNMPVITEDRQAAELAEELNAHLVLYGAVDFNDEEGLGTFTPRFYVVDRPDMKNSEDVIGYNQLAHPVVFNTEFESEEQLKQTLRVRAAILTNFTSGLVFMNAENFTAARQRFQLAISEAESIAPFEGMEVLYLMLAYVYKLQGDFQPSLQILNRALERNPTYARALVGIGNTYYLMALQNFQKGEIIDGKLLEQAQQAYARATDPASSDVFSDAHIQEKAAIGLGNVQFLLALQHQDLTYLNRAVDYYQSVADEYEGEGTETALLARLAAIAHCNIGDVLEWRGDDSGARKERTLCTEIQQEAGIKLLSPQQK